MKSESEEQIDFLQWTKRCAAQWPELALLFAIPNGGKRHIATASRMKLEGVKPGVPDLFLPVARRGFHGLFIEMKSCKGKLSKDQECWQSLLEKEGYAFVTAHGCANAQRFIKSYLNIT